MKTVIASPHVVANPYDFLLEHKEEVLKNVLVILFNVIKMNEKMIEAFKFQGE